LLSGLDAAVGRVGCFYSCKLIDLRGGALCTRQGRDARWTYGLPAGCPRRRSSRFAAAIRI